MQKKVSLQEERRKLNLTQEELADKLGVTREYLSMVERGAKPLSRKLSQKFSEMVSKKVPPLETKAPSNQTPATKDDLEKINSDLATITDRVSSIEQLLLKLIAKL